jgi:hypothetical protein
MRQLRIDKKEPTIFLSSDLAMPSANHEAKYYKETAFLILSLSFLVFWIIRYWPVGLWPTEHLSSRTGEQ